MAVPTLTTGRMVPLCTNNQPILGPGFVNYKKRCTRLADKVYQLLAHGRWFSPGMPASSTTKTGLHDMAEIFAKSGVKHQKFN